MLELDKLEIAFNQSYKDIYLNKRSEKYRSKHWKSYYEKKRYEIKNLKNFRNPISNLSRGLDDSTENPDFPFKIFSKLIELLGYDFVYENLLNKNIGNSPFLIKYRNKFIDYNRLAHISWLKDLEDKVFSDKKLWEKFNNNGIFCEIGGGFGSFAELILSRHDIKYISIDLPEANLLSSYFLNESFKNKKFFLYDDYLKNGKILTSELIKSYDIFILPPSVILDEDVKIPLFINTRSMMEMDFSVVSKYFDLIHSYIDKNGYFLNVNRYEKRTVGHPIRIAEYPYDANWKVLISKPSFSQKRVHQLLTKRVSNPSLGNINKELNSISKIGAKYYLSKKQIISIFIYEKFILRIKKMLKRFLI